MIMLRPLAIAAIAAAAIACGSPVADAQTQYRPGEASARYSGDDPDSGNNQLMSFLDRIGALDAEPETYAPLPQARQIMDELAANGNLRDAFLQQSWEGLGQAADGIDAAIRLCNENQLDDAVRAVRRIGENLHTSWRRIAGLRDQLVDLYQSDVRDFEEMTAPNDSSVPVLEDGGRRTARYTVTKTINLLLEWNRMSPEVRALARNAGSRLLLPLAVAQTAYDAGVAGIMTYEAFTATRRLPHILEKHEMIVYLGELSRQYGILNSALNTVLSGLRQDFERFCRCRYAGRVGFETFDELPTMDEREKALWENARARLILQSIDNPGSRAYRQQELERRIRDMQANIDRAREQREAADAARRAQPRDETALRQQYQQYLDNSQLDADRTNARRHQREYQEERDRRERYRRQREGQ